MPRNRGAAAPAPRRPVAAAPPPRAPAQQQTRPASTTAVAPSAQQQRPPVSGAQQPTASQGPGLFGQMASTAAGVAVGSSIGHAIGGFFGGGSSSAAAPEQTNMAAGTQDSNGLNYEQQSAGGVCEGQVGNFRSCMDQNRGDLTICGWYLDQLKACQQAASQY